MIEAAPATVVRGYLALRARLQWLAPGFGSAATVAGEAEVLLGLTSCDTTSPTSRDPSSVPVQR